MSNIASPLQFASVASALIWPLAAGVAVVVCSKVRTAAQARRAAAADEIEAAPQAAPPAANEFAGAASGLGPARSSDDD